MKLFREDDDIYEGIILKLRRYYNQYPTMSRQRPISHSSNHVAMITGSRGRILSLGRNKLKTHPLQAHFAQKLGKPERIYLHAETDAVIKCINKHGIDALRDADIFIVRFSKKGDTASSKPCNMCRYMLQSYAVRHVFHT